MIACVAGSYAENGLRLMTSKVTRCRWIGCVSAVVLTRSQSSTALAVGRHLWQVRIVVEIRCILDVQVDRVAGERVERL